MIDFEKELNPAQLEAVQTLDGPVLVIAGAGSGKTRTIVYRMANIVHSGYSPESILLLTFTRKAAQEMLNRAGTLLGEQGLWGVTGGTFHSFAYSWLRRYAEVLGAKNGLTVMDQSDAEGIVRDIKDDMRIGKGDRSFPKRGTLLSLISKSRNKEVPLSDILRGEAYHLAKYEDELEQLSKGYNHFKMRHGLLDYDDLLFGLERLLREHEPARDLARSRYGFVMVDEFQDTNLVQARIVKLLAGESGNVMAVGDDAQSIYAFRGANVRNILEFPKQFPGTKLIRLEQNYRSAQPVLDLTNAILEPAELKFKKSLFSERKDGPKPQVIRTMSDRSQANAVLNKVLELSKKYPLHEIAVLFRAGYHSYPVEVALNKVGMKFQKFGGLKFSEAAHIKDVLGYLRLVQNPSDIPSWQRVLSHVKGVGPKTVSKIYTAVMTGNDGYLATARTRWPEVGETLEFLDTQRTLGGTPAAMLARSLKFYEPILERRYPDDYPRRKSGLEELERIATQYEDLESFLGDISLENPQDDDDGGKENTLVLSTVHSAKGLEWSAVLVIDLVQERFPSRHALNGSDELEEERRLMYVACTRAKDYLGLFVPSTIYNQYNHTSEPALESPFLIELPEKYYESWRENFSGSMAKVKTAAPQPAMAEAVAPADAGAKPAAGTKRKLGYCRHKIFGRGKIIAAVSDDKYRINFPGFGLKVIMADFLKFE